MRHTCKPTMQDAEAAAHYCKFKASLSHTDEERRACSIRRWGWGMFEEKKR